MAGLAAPLQPLIDPNLSYPTDISRATALLRSSSWPLGETVSTALENLQNNANQLQQALRNPGGLEQIQVRATSGQVIANIGPYVVNGVQTSGGMFAELYAGFPPGISDPAQAKLVIKPDGTFTIAGVTSISLGSSGNIVLDSSTGQIRGSSLSIGGTTASPNFTVQAGGSVFVNNGPLEVKTTANADFVVNPSFANQLVKAQGLGGSPNHQFLVNNGDVEVHFANDSGTSVSLQYAQITPTGFSLYNISGVASVVLDGGGGAITATSVSATNFLAVVAGVGHGGVSGSWQITTNLGAVTFTFTNGLLTSHVP